MNLDKDFFCTSGPVNVVESLRLLISKEDIRHGKTDLNELLVLLHSHGFSKLVTGAHVLPWTPLITSCSLAAPKPLPLFT